MSQQFCQVRARLKPIDSFYLSSVGRRISGSEPCFVENIEDEVYHIMSVEGFRFTLKESQMGSYFHRPFDLSLSRLTKRRT